MSVGVVVIGRNEGRRLERCLESVRAAGVKVLYVDSGSADASVAAARRLGVEVLALDASLPFSAARARNEGFRRLLEMDRGLRFVQFLDGDCELAAGWPRRAARFLDAHPRVALVCGRLREREPERSIYNLLCDIEWDASPGETRACGGIAMARAEAFAAAGGFRPDLIAGEEPELCVRLRAAGWRIWRLRHDMASHDAAMTRFGQWWRRNERAGYAFAQGALLHGAAPERHWVRESRSAWLWALGVPLAALGCAAWLGPAGLLVLAVYPLQVVRLALRGRRSRRENWWRGLFLVLGKFPEVIGQARFFARRGLGGTTRLIEYK